MSFWRVSHGGAADLPRRWDFPGVERQALRVLSAGQTLVDSGMKIVTARRIYFMIKILEMNVHA
jgi:hypothetical protein